MDRAAFHNHMEATFKECLDISRRKNQDYAGNTDPFGNFRIVEGMGLCSVETGIVVRMTDKLARISNLIGREAQVKDEAIEDTLNDLVNYAAILKAYIASRKE
jgi:hypothetical protein